MPVNSCGELHLNSMKVGETCEYMWRTPDLDERAIHTDLGALPPLREEHRTRRYCAPALFTIVHMYIALHRIRAMRQSIICAHGYELKQDVL